MPSLQQIDSKYDISEDLELPAELLQSWQSTIDLMAQIVGVPAGLIMRVHQREIEVLIASSNKDNVYEPGEKADLDTGLYCETVMDTQEPLMVPDALQDPDWNKNPDIKLGMISYYGVPLCWPDGKVFGTVCVLDKEENAYNNEYISLVKKFRESVQLGLQTLYDKNQLELAQNQLVQSSKLAALGTMSASLGHEMNQPLGVIDMAADMATDAIANDSQDMQTVKNSLQRIQTQVQRASNLVKQLSDFSRSSPNAKTEKTDPKKMVETIELITKESMKRPNINFELKLDQDLPDVMCRATQIEQVLLNLIVNAKNAIRESEQPDSGKITLSMKAENDQLTVSVNDNGIGIAIENLNKVFDPFFTTSAPGKGTGLGLSISHSIIKKHSGEITVTSELGKGSEFVFTLPLTNAK